MWSAHPEGSRRRHLFYAAAVLLICGAAIAIGAPPALKYADDFSQFFDGGWRVFNGQRPHLDFYSPYGVFFYFPMAVGLMFSHTARAMGYSNAVVGLIVGIWAYGIARRRMASSPSILASLLLTLLATAPYPLGEPPWVSSYAMIYNRQAYSILGILLIEAYGALSRESASKRFELIAGLSSGAVTGILFFLKPSYFMMAVAVLAATFLCRRPSRTRLAVLAGGFSIVTLGVLCYLKFDVGALVNDLSTIAGARSTGLDMAKFRQSVIASALPSLTLMVCALLAQRTAGSLPDGGYLLRHRRVIFAALVSLAGFLLLLTNWQYWGLPLNALFAIVLAAEIRYDARRAFPSVVLALTLMVVALPAIASDALGFGHALWESGQSRSAASLIGAATLAGFVIPPDSTDPGPAYVTYINDGVDLLRKASSPHETVANLDFSNPFGYALGRLPFRGGCVAMQHHFTFSDEHTASPEWLLGGADLVMVPKRPTLPIEPLMRIYGEFLHRRFRLCAESSRWLLYRQIR